MPGILPQWAALQRVLRARPGDSRCRRKQNVTGREAPATKSCSQERSFLLGTTVVSGSFHTEIMTFEDPNLVPEAALSSTDNNGALYVNQRIPRASSNTDGKCFLCSLLSLSYRARFSARFNFVTVCAHICSAGHRLS